MKPEYLDKYPYMFQPMNVGKGKKQITFKNRILTPPMTLIGGVDGNGLLNTEAGVTFHGEMARGGFAAVCIPFEFPRDAMHSCSLEIASERLNSHKAVHYLERYVHSFQCMLGIEIYHPGCAVTATINQSRILSASDMVWNGLKVTGMNQDDMEQVADDFAKYSVWAIRCGADYINLHFAHGWLINQFLSPLSNHRKDEYGGSVENRCRFPIMVLERIRKTIGDVPIELRLSGNDRMEGGITPEDAIEQAKILAPYVDMIHFTCGNRLDASTRAYMHPTYFVPPGHNRDASSLAMKANLPCKVGVVGSINTPQLAESIIANGEADYVLIARQAKLDNEFVNKIREGRELDIRPCLRCDVCNDSGRRGALAKELTIDSLATFNLFCAVDPYYAQGAMVKKYEKPPTKIKRIAIIGGGPAGLNAAMYASERGHQVTLFEKSDRLGGQINIFCEVLWHKKEFKWYRDWLIRQVKKTNTQICLNIEDTAEMINKMDFDAVIVAIGGEEIVPNIPGINGQNVLMAWDVFGHEDIVGQNVVIIGGGMTGCELGMHLSEAGRNVSILEMGEYIAPNGILSQRIHIQKFMAEAGTKWFTGHKVTKIVANGVYANAEEGSKFFPADNVIICTGTKSKAKERDTFAATAFDVINIGDCYKASDLVNATTTGNNAAMSL